MKQLRHNVIVACILCLGLWLPACANASGQKLGSGAEANGAVASDAATSEDATTNDAAAGDGTQTGDATTAAQTAGGSQGADTADAAQAADAKGAAQTGDAAQAADATDAAQAGDTKAAATSDDAAKSSDKSTQAKAPEDAEASDTKAASDTEAEPSQPYVVTPGANAVTEEDVISRKELAEPKEFVAFGDYAAMETLAKAVSEGQKEGVVVQVDGIVTKLSDSEPHAIVQKSADGATQVGVAFFIEWIGDDSYPAEGAHVVLSGKVIPDNSASGYSIHTTKEFVRVQP